jgi:hypothetical protein
VQRVSFAIAGAIVLLAAPAASAHRLTFTAAMGRYVEQRAASAARSLARPSTVVTLADRRYSCRATVSTPLHRHRARCRFSWTLTVRTAGTAPVVSLCRGRLILKASTETATRLVTAARQYACTVVGGPAPAPAAPLSTKATPDPPTPPEATVLAAGDITGCHDEAQQTATILDTFPDADVITLGDNAYSQGTAAQYAGCYDPTWGRAKARTHPAPGNHEYRTPGASGYFAYFGAAAGPGYYSFDLGDWHLISLDSEIPVTPGSAQYQWLAADLTSHPTRCTLAYWHKPRFSAGAGTGQHGDNAYLGSMYALLYDRGVDVLLVGHDHNYQRFAPLDPSGAIDPARGLRNFVVGTGGRDHYADLGPHVGLEAANVDTSGVLKLSLRAEDYSWIFLPIAGRTFTDAGTQSCH